MLKLIRAEVYRLLHSGMYLRILLLGGLVMSLMPWLTDVSLWDKTLAQNLESILLGNTVFFSFYLFAVTLVVAMGYMKKTAYYEVMAGYKKREILGSKLIVNGGTVGILYFILASWLAVAVSVKNGTGGVTELPLRALLLLVLFLHGTCLATLIGMTFKHFAAVGISFFRMQFVDLMLAEIVPALVKAEHAETAQKVARWTFSRQMSELFRCEISAELTVCIIGSFLAEVCLWYGIAYYTMKKKWYK